MHFLLKRKGGLLYFNGHVTYDLTMTPKIIYLSKWHYEISKPELWAKKNTFPGKNTIETVEKSLTDMFIRLVRIYPCLLVFVKIETSSKIRDIFYVILDAGHMGKNRDCPAKLGAVGKYVYPDIFLCCVVQKELFINYGLTVLFILYKDAEGNRQTSK